MIRETRGKGESNLSPLVYTGLQFRSCRGRRFAVLEGGYNHDVLGKNVKAFLERLD